MVALSDISSRLNELLEPDTYQDAAWNGLQVESSMVDIQKVGLAVDSGESIIERAADEGCQLLIVHHGLFWGTGVPLTGIIARKVSQLLTSGCSLYASHLPLDGNADLGNAFELARALELQDLQPFCVLDGKTIGAQGKFSTALSLQEVEQRLSTALNLPNAPTDYYPFTLAFGPSEVRTVGIATGSGSFAVEVSANEGHDLFITGEPKQEVYHLTKELKMNALFGGHYATETFGVKALGALLEKEFAVSTLFLDEPTGI